MRFRRAVVVGLTLAASSFLLQSTATSASLEKAKVLRTNGLATEAKRELVELTFDSNVSRAEKAEALLLLGDMRLTRTSLMSRRKIGQRLLMSSQETLLRRWLRRS